MRQLSKTETALLLTGGLLMVVGSGAYMLLQQWACYVFSVGALLFVAMQLRQRYEGNDFTIRRLRRLMIVSDVLFLLSALLMIADQSNFLPFDYLSYLRYVRNNWIVALLIAAVLQLYVSHRIANELEKAKKR